MEKYGKYPINARIDIDYTERKPKVKIGYPTNKPKKEVINQVMRTKVGFSILIIVGILIWAIFSLIFISIFNDNEIYPTNCSTTQIENNSKLEGLNITCEDNTYKLGVSYGLDCLFYKAYPSFYNKRHQDIYNLIGGIIIAIIIYFFAWLITKKILKKLSKNKKFQRWLPEYEAKSKKKRYYKFTTKDIENNQAIVPSFSNVELSYKTKGEFSTYLNNIKVREHKSHLYKKVKGKWKVGKLKRDYFHWYAIFSFSQKPNKGYLEVIFQ